MENKRTFWLGMFSGVCVMIFALMMFYSVKWYLGYFTPASAQGTENPTASPAADSNVDEKLKRINDLLNSYYIDGYSDESEELVESFYRDVVASIGDPYTTYMTAEEYVKFTENTEGIYAGIGVVVSVDIEKNLIVIVSPYEGYPGQLAGMLPGDYITHVNGGKVYGDKLDDAIKMMKGTPGTSVNVTFFRSSTNQEYNVDIVRQTINIPTVSHKMLDNQIGYLRISQFDVVTTKQFTEAYNDLKGQNMQGLIIDLRNNPGGLLDVVCTITDLLVPEGNITYTEDKNGFKQYSKSDKNRIEVPLVLLINEGSASASEVMTGAVTDLGVGVTVGTKTFGKGIVQKIYTLPDRSAVKITTSKYYTPSGVCIQGIGIEPDYPVEMDDELSIRISSLTLDEDVQLKKAVDVMTEKISQSN